jgi:hypothetical protein
MPWKVCSAMEERLRFIARLIEGEAPQAPRQGNGLASPPRCRVRHSPVGEVLGSPPRPGRRPAALHRGWPPEAPLRRRTQGFLRAAERAERRAHPPRYPCQCRVPLVRGGGAHRRSRGPRRLRAGVRDPEKAAAGRPSAVVTHAQLARGACGDGGRQA